MPVAYLDVSADLLIELCKGLNHSDTPRCYLVTQNALPPDAQFRHIQKVSLNAFSEVAVTIAIDSESFRGGEQLPAVRLQCVNVEHTELVKKYETLVKKYETLVKKYETLLTALKAVWHAVSHHCAATGDVIWIREPYQATGVHESVDDRIAAALDTAGERGTSVP